MGGVEFVGVANRPLRRLNKDRRGIFKQVLISFEFCREVETALGNAIRAARAAAQPGDIITRQAAAEFRRLIKKEYQSRNREERKIFLDEVPHFRPKVNQTYPSAWPLATFPTSLLDVLPKLPDVLEYRILDEALILRDVKANIVVDFILDVY